jgi:rhodanese-related sulfurtransferase
MLTAILSAARAADPPPPVQTPLVEASQLLSEQKAAKPLVLDVRTPGEFSAGHVPCAINIPHDQLATRLAELPSSRDEPVVVYCRSGRRAALAEDVLRQNGYSNVRHLKGDMLGWEAESRPVERAK